MVFLGCNTSNKEKSIEQHNSEKNDTLNAIINKQDITIEGKVTTSIKIDFAKYYD